LSIEKCDMTRSIYIKEIITILKEPLVCPNCNKEDKLEKGIISETRSGGKTILCSRCEALIVVTSHNLKKVELAASNDIMILLKEPHLIRKVTY
jgi:transcription elongation factor Elf1